MVNKEKGVPILVIGDSGSGKSSMFGKVMNEERTEVIIQGLPPEKTIILNTEDKKLPAENALEFVDKIMDTYKKLDATLDALQTPAGEEKYDYVVLDSFTAMTETINRYCNFAYDGWEQWKGYNTIIIDILIKIKKLKQQVFVVALPENKDIGFNEIKAYARIKGKELKFGYLEQQFAVVLFTNEIYDDESGEVIDIELTYKSNKKNTAKAPVGLFLKRPRNDAKFIAERVKEFYGLGRKAETAS